MKRFILLLSFLFGISSSFLACKDAEKEAGETEIIEEETETEVYEEGGMDDGFGVYDENGDSMLDENEFGEANQTAFAEWDEDDNSSLNDEEFFGSTFDVADVNNDDMIDENEWNEGRNNLYADYAGENDWDVFDKDEDGFLSSDEWSQGFAESDWFDNLDENDDELVDNNEWNSSLFGVWDTNKDGYLDEQEYTMNNRNTGNS